jgi:hypothetical protein
LLPRTKGSHTSTCELEALTQITTHKGGGLWLTGESNILLALIEVSIVFGFDVESYVNGWNYYCL